MKNIEKMGIKKIAFLQALGDALYITGIGTVLWNGDKLLPIDNDPLGPILFLTLFSVSILICGIITFGYPVYLIWEKKDARTAIRLVGFTTIWLTIFFFTVLSLIFILP